MDFAKHNCAGIQWTTNKTRVLSLNGVKAVEVKEDELGIPVTASYHVKVPPRHNAVFEVNIHAETQGTQVITGNKHLLEKHPNMYQHKIAMLAEENCRVISMNMVIVNTWVFILRRYKWHIHAGSWSLVNCSGGKPLHSII